MARPLAEVVEPGWAGALAPAADRIAAMGEFLRAENAAGRGYLPAGANVLRAFQQPFGDVRVLIVGQDPYPTPGHAVGLSFSVAPDVRPVPRSLANIFTEYSADLGYPTPSTGDLTPWARQGVLLLNRVLTVSPGQPASHRGKGWEATTEQAIRALVDRRGPLVAILWGRDASTLKPMLDDVPTIESRTRRRCRRRVGSSVRGRSRGRTRCSSSVGRTRWSGDCRNRAIVFFVSTANEPPEPTTRTFRGDGGLELAGDVWGPADGPLVVMLHGGGQTRHSWKSAGAKLAANGMRVVALDARGHGDSAWHPDGDYRRADHGARPGGRHRGSRRPGDRRRRQHGRDDRACRRPRSPGPT